MSKIFMLLLLTYYAVAQNIPLSSDLELSIDTNKKVITKNDTLIIYTKIQNNGSNPITILFHEILFHISINNINDEDSLKFYTGYPYYNLFYDTNKNNADNTLKDSYYYIPLSSEGSYQFRIILDKQFNTHSPGFYKINLMYIAQKGHKPANYWVGHLKSNTEKIKIEK